MRTQDTTNPRHCQDRDFQDSQDSGTGWCRKILAILTSQSKAMRGGGKARSTDESAKTFNATFSGEASPENVALNVDLWVVLS